MNEIRCFSCGAINPSDKDGIFRKNCWDCGKPLDGTIVVPLQDTPSLPKQEGEKKQDWEHLLEMCIYTVLIGYTEEGGYSIPCKVREDMKRRAVDRFKKELYGRGFIVTKQPSPPAQEPDRPVEDTPQEKKRPHGEITDVVGCIPVEQAFRTADWIDKEIEFQLSTANATIEALKEELCAIKHQCEKEPLAFLLSNALRLLSMEQMISLADSLYERTPAGSGIRAELAKYKDNSPKY